MLSLIFGRWTKYLIIGGIVAIVLTGMAYYIKNIIADNAEMKLQIEQQTTIIEQQKQQMQSIRDDYNEQLAINNQLNDHYTQLLDEYFQMDAQLAEANINMNTAHMTAEEKVKYLTQQSAVLQALYEQSLSNLPRMTK